MIGLISTSSLIIILLALAGIFFAAYKVRNSRDHRISMVLFLIGSVTITGYMINSELEYQLVKDRLYQQFRKLGIERKALRNIVDDLQESNRKLENKIIKYKEPKQQRDSDLRPVTLEEYTHEIERMDRLTPLIEQQRIRTRFELVDYIKKEIDGGRYFIFFELAPIGKNRVSVFHLRFEADSGAIWEFDVKMKDQKVPWKWDKNSKDYIALGFRKIDKRTMEFRGPDNMKPENILVTVVTRGDPGVPLIDFYPRK